jgi:uncharacterized iron-regulated membrane protein
MNSQKTVNPAPRQKNWLLAHSRQWHMWGGLLAGIFILIAGASGILLNYKQPVFSFLGLERKEARRGDIKVQSPALTPLLKITESGALPSAIVNFDGALKIARSEFGDAALERIEIKDERGELIYKIKAKKGSELWINAQTGLTSHKAERERLVKTGGKYTAQTDWGKILIDLHTGKIGGEIGKAVMSAAAFTLIFLTVSGVYLWAKPLLIRRQNRLRRPLPTASPPAGPSRKPADAEPQLQRV